MKNELADILKSKSGIYFFVDPFARFDSGVTTYIKMAINKLEDVGFACKVIKIKESESIEEFRGRIALFFNDNILDICCIEAPESLAATALLNDSLPIHIRLHCSRSLGAAIQGKSYELDAVILEQKEISRAKYLSSPSWAAYFASCSIFKFDALPVIYPNPAPSYTPKNNCLPKHDVLFIGRLQNLKGKLYLEKIVKKLPNVNFAFATTKSTKPESFRAKNVTFYDGKLLSKNEVYSLASNVIVPSMFETSSMVGLEALSHGSRIITWEHLGFCEYVDIPEQIIKIPTENLNHFIKTVEFYSKKNVAFDSFPITLINDEFIKGIRIVLSKNSEGGTSIKRPNGKIEFYLRHIIEVKKKSMKESRNASPLYRKTRKLIKNPFGFIKDSYGYKYVSGNKIQSEDMPPIKISPLKVDNETKLLSSVKNSSSNDTHISISTVNGTKIKVFGNIPEIGKIEFKKPPEKPAGHIVSFFSSENEDENFIDSILGLLNEYDDFKYVGKERLQIGKFSIDPAENSLKLLNRIDVSNKLNFSMLNFAILVNPPLALCLVLRSIGTEHRIIAINTKPENELENLSEHVDVLITTQKLDEDCSQSYRRYIHVLDNSTIHVAIRRALQEGFERKIDVLLALQPEREVFTLEDFDNFDKKNYQGIIKIKKEQHLASTTMDDIYTEFSEKVIGIALLESVYMRYRTQSEFVENNGSPRNLIDMCLTDGVIFDVKEV